MTIKIDFVYKIGSIHLKTKIYIDILEFSKADSFQKNSKFLVLKEFKLEIWIWCVNYVNSIYICLLISFKEAFFIRSINFSIWFFWTRGNLDLTLFNLLQKFSVTAKIHKEWSFIKKNWQNLCSVRIHYDFST